jgi:hypothetical protein
MLPPHRGPSFDPPGSSPDLARPSPTGSGAGAGSSVKLADSGPKGGRRGVDSRLAGKAVPILGWSLVSKVLPAGSCGMERPFVFLIGGWVIYEEMRYAQRRLTSISAPES